MAPSADLNQNGRHERDAFYTEPTFEDSHAPVNVIIVGAGVAGLITAILLSRKVRNISLTVYDKSSRIGGTWSENVYPGVRCDVPSHCYQTTFAPNLEWSQYYSEGAEIRSYYENLARRFGILESVRLQREVIEATWSASKGHWVVKVKDIKTGDVTVDHAQFLVSAQGRLSKPEMPDIPGLEDNFSGKVLHTAKWDSEYDLRGKRVAIIGNGASGQQLLPTILPAVEHIDHYVRSRVWVTPTLQKGLIQATEDQPGGYRYTKADKERFKSDPAYYVEYRRGIESLLHNRFPKTVLGSNENEALRKACIATMLDRVNGDQAWFDKLVPEFAPGCKRLTPAPGYLEALQDPKVTYVDVPIVHTTSKGIVASDGVEREVDTIIAATGFGNGSVPYFPTIGLDGVDLSKLWATDGPLGYPETYFGIMAPYMPNYFTVLQAQGSGAGGSIPLQCEISATYIAKVIRKIQRESYKSITPSQHAVEEFNDLCLGHFRDKVIADNCSSWLKTNGPKPRSLVWWPGSGYHRMDLLRDPRWEDFSYERKDNARTNRYAYFGSGWTEREKSGDKHKMTAYLEAVDKVDIELLHEYWNR